MTSMTRPVSSLLAMGYIVLRARTLNIHINTTKLQKLMYACYGACLAKYGVKICEENPEAWQHGPVFPRTLDALRGFGIEFFEQMDVSALLDVYSEDVKMMVDDVLKGFGRFAANQLVEWTHQKDSPWSVASDNGRILFRQIPDSLILDYFDEHVIAK